MGQAKKDNGVLILLAKADRKVFITTGYGMEDIITDALAKRIVENYLLPNFKKGNFFQGLNEASEVITGLATGKFTADQIRGRRKAGKVGIFKLLFLVFIMVFIFGNIFRNQKKFRNSRMSSGGMDFLTGMMMMSLFSGMGRRSYYGDFSSGGGMFGGGSGGGFGGFGGGMTGGGGAGGSW